MKVNICKWALSVLTILSIPAGLAAQYSEISQSDYNKGLNSAFWATHTVFPRKVTENQTLIENGSVTSLNTMSSEYQSVDNFRIVTEYSMGDNVKTEEYIRVGSDNYCRNNSSPWTKNAPNCNLSPLEPDVLADAMVGSKYFLEKVVVGGEAGSAITRNEIYLASQAGKTDPWRFHLEDKLFLMGDSRMYTRTILTYSDQPVSIGSRHTFEYVYGITRRKIEAPIK